MQLGTPITIINGGISAVITVISQFRNPNTPKDHITPIKTTIREIKVALKDLKNRKNIKEVKAIAEKTKTLIFLLRYAITLILFLKDILSDR